MTSGASKSFGYLKCGNKFTTKHLCVIMLCYLHFFRINFTHPYDIKVPQCGCNVKWGQVTYGCTPSPHIIRSFDLFGLREFATGISHILRYVSNTTPCQNVHCKEAFFAHLDGLQTVDNWILHRGFPPTSLCRSAFACLWFHTQYLLLIWILKVVISKTQGCRKHALDAFMNDFLKAAIPAM